MDGPLVRAVRRRWDLTVSVDVVPPVRYEVDRALLEAGVGQRCREDIGLAVSELATNAIVHGRPPQELLVEVDDDEATCRVEVLDADPGLPVRTAAAQRSGLDGHAVGGYGLVIVEAVSSDWGSEAMAAGGKRVWATFDLEAQPAGD
jgi:anti-sigma regulatory factor (Ser/Thr protein kinase)